ncbi:hypothetical protein [Methylobacter tundripaludum]|uniref:Uncharacterized protein n=1 Tax=Methylobacter tundripaludum (strain ATCC BAA-1195 / DSM 17260 / SV96) TaxID=697282 RepID=G3IYS4_METTV|nr:hypothetical protein [Methylobacter tundripaludum]EGW21225.1 hypothetical protein Mettu_4390 [Methylobacter tundripaludum SV96]
MQTQSAKTPTPRESVTITLTTREFAFIQGMIYARSFLNHQESDDFKVCEVNNINFVDRLKKKLDYFQPNIGDACATPAHIPEAPGQGGTYLQPCSVCGVMSCPGCGYLFAGDPDPFVCDCLSPFCPNCFPDAQSSEAVGQGGNQ